MESTYLAPLTLFTNAVPTGVAMLILDSILGQSLSAEIEQEELIANIVETILPRSELLNVNDNRAVVGW